MVVQWSVKSQNHRNKMGSGIVRAVAARAPRIQLLRQKSGGGLVLRLGLLQEPSARVAFRQVNPSMLHNRNGNVPGSCMPSVCSPKLNAWPSGYCCNTMMWRHALQGALRYVGALSVTSASQVTPAGSTIGKRAASSTLKLGYGWTASQGWHSAGWIPSTPYHATTILCVRKDGQVCRQMYSLPQTFKLRICAADGCRKCMLDWPMAVKLICIPRSFS
jgi:hypothetical protein